jgi:transcription elongation factor GreA-like protein
MFKKKFNNLFKKARKIIQPGKKISTPTYKDPYMLQLQIQSLNELLDTELMQEQIRMKIRLSFTQS